MSCFKTCPRKHYYCYVLGIDSATPAKALRMGSAFHAGVETLARGNDLDAAIHDVQSYYSSTLNMGLVWNQIEQTTVCCIVAGYYWHYHDDGISYVVTEEQFQIPFDEHFDCAGKVDGIVREEGSDKLFVMEHKLLGDDLQDESLWKRVRLDQQISMYIRAARQMGYALNSCLYDLARKPKILPRAKGRDLTPAEWADKLSNDIAERPEFYYERREVTRTDKELSDFEADLVGVSSAIRSGYVYHTVDKASCPWCQYFPLCAEAWREDEPLHHLLTFKQTLNPELALAKEEECE